MAYGVYIGTYEKGRSVKADEIADALDPQNPEHARMIESMRRLDREGMRYSNEDCDVFGPAFRAARATGHVFPV